ncbi:exodeoxyribonuclease V subunit gamma [candidate division WOR-3 bacterium]|nr:exodeoxyribonuclease V subunit gamma [candidate division WOR-3 bacterium]
MGDKPLRLLAYRPLSYSGFMRNLLRDLEITERFRCEEILYLTPNKRRARAAEFDILSLYKEDVNMTPIALDLQTLAQNLVLARCRKGIVDERDRRFLLLKLIGQTAGLSFREEHLGLLSNLYAELKRHWPTDWHQIPEQAKKTIFDLDTALRLKQSIELLESYDHYLNTQGLLDHEDLLHQAIGEVPILAFKFLILEGYFEPWTSEQQLFKELVNHIPEILVIIPEDPVAQKGERFFQDFGFVQYQSEQPHRLPVSFWHRYPSREDEVIAIARKICSLIEEGIYPDEIIVVFPALGTYRPIVERVFSRYRIKVQISLRPRLASLPAIREVLNLLNTAEGGFRRRDVVGLLLSRCFQDVPDSVRHWLDVLSRDAGIISGAKVWADWFGANLPHRLREHPEAVRLNTEIRDFIAEFILRLKEFVQPHAAKAFVEKLNDVLDWLGWEPGVEARQGFKDIAEKLIRMAELADSTTMSLRFYLDVLEILFKKEAPHEGEDKEGVIRVMPLVESRWLETKYLFVGGLVDGEFPRRPYRDLLLPDRLRAALNLPTVEDSYLDAAFEFRRLSSMASKACYLSAPSMEADRPLLASIFLLEREENEEVTDPAIYCTEEDQLLERSEGNQMKEGVKFETSSALGLLGDRFGEHHPFRVTLLEIYRNCPFRYYLSKVLGLEVSEEPTLEPEGRLLGTIMHDMLEDLFKKGVDLNRLEEQFWDSLLHELDRRRLNPFVRLWIEDWAGARMDWFADTERARAEAGWMCDPEWLERPLELRFNEEGFFLKGRVDRVDWKENRAKVLDYKTGKERYFKLKVKKGESIQLPLYAEMIKRLYNIEVESIGIYGFADSKIDEIALPDQAMQDAVGFAWQAIEGIRNGHFPSMKSSMCRYCEYYEFC